MQWSGSMSFASAESDFTASDRFSTAATTSATRSTPEWSETMSFASTESDFVASDHFSSAPSSEWSESMSFASAESDFVASNRFASRNDDNDDRVQNRNERDPQHAGYYNSLSPESALGAVHVAEMLDEKAKKQLQSLVGDDAQKEEATLWASLSTGRQSEVSSAEADEVAFEKLFSSLPPITSPESALGSIHVAEMIDESTKAQLLKAFRNNNDNDARRRSIPQTMSDVLADARPIVVTSRYSPFDIVEVNDAWVGLCGFTREEAAGQNLGNLLQGPETSGKTAIDMIARLKRDHYSEAVLTNYTKTGRKFMNHVKLGVLSNERGEEDFFVGILEEIGSGESAASKKMEAKKRRELACGVGIVTWNLEHDENNRTFCSG
eukprot:CAMPEP_0116998418 /NCGR_PEP_ID=MMETSP0472-20121206/1496_1 /TAXON_ID=693140 ORGANISM="Tiarina fusus, Strain LIS" /NCGR_SAMPLE_ID=MMETSP0472 /ASSEMBLY_ACC=CAM_ASM_000603 /LENGTH=379 /DNA_ID=CAMNT_0004697563 /DNA_START=225 /DNA_END=1365 /DNA_ORIENTATION=+